MSLYLSLRFLFRLALLALFSMALALGSNGLKAQGDILLSPAALKENAPRGTFIGQLSLESDLPGLEWWLPADSADNSLVFLRGDSLFSASPVNFEASPLLTIHAVARHQGRALTASQVEVMVEDQSGKWDSNGLADAELAAYYGVQPGDFLLLSPNVNQRSFFLGAGVPAISFPNHIRLLAGSYDVILLNLAPVAGNSPDERVTISNLGGQVKARKVLLQGGAFWRFTGQSTGSFGHPDFPGCVREGSTVNMGFGSGQFGIWIQNGYSSDEVALTVYGAATGFELDHLEISDGGFAGIMVKQEGGTADMEDLFIHHTYIHDVGGEGMYLGSTNPDPQHQLNRVVVEHNTVLRTHAEAFQAGQLGPGIEVRNNVFWGGMGWKAPFAMHQDHTVQLSLRGGRVVFENNILLAAGNAFFNLQTRGLEGATPSTDSLIIRNNLAWQGRGPLGAFQAEESGAVRTVMWRENIFGGFRYDYDKVYTARPVSDHVIRVASNDQFVAFRDNVVEPARGELFEAWAGSNATIVDFGNYVREAEAPAFRNLTGEWSDFLSWQTWTPVVGPSSAFLEKNTRKGDSVLYVPGDIVGLGVNGRTRFYRCLQANVGQRPGTEGDARWELLRWQGPQGWTFVPPDDARLEAGSAYFLQNMGLEASFTDPHGGPTPIQEGQGSRQGLQVFPNPAQGHVRVIPGGRGTQEVAVWSSQGQLLMRSRIPAEGGDLVLPDCSPGVYSVVVQREGQVIAGRLVVQ